MTSNWSESRACLASSLALQLALVAWAYHVDTHPEQFGGLKYTDVDWRVITDGTALIWGTEGKRASGWLVQTLGWDIGDPYQRATFRYTPLLAVLVSPTLIHPILGRLLLCCLSLLVPIVLLAKPDPAPFWPAHLLWTFNPFVLNITTRGSPEAIVILLVVATLACLRRADAGKRAWWESWTAIVFALGVSWKIYPVIHIPVIWSHLASRHGWLGWPVWRFGLIAAGTFAAVNLALWSIWGQPFLDHTFLYHLHRQDHRHNFSSYFYPIYLSFFPPDTEVYPSIIQAILQHPLTSFVPQFGLVTLAGFLLTPGGGVELAVFVQTAIFVIFNKVCTSQYFTWFLPFLPALLPRLELSRQKWIVIVAAWVVAQGAWLATAYQLEFQGSAVYLPLWGAGIGLLVVSTWIVGQLLDAYAPVKEGTMDQPEQHPPLDQPERLTTKDQTEHLAPIDQPQKSPSKRSKRTKKAS